MGYEKEGFQDYEEEINWDQVGSVVAVGRYDVELVKGDYKPTEAGKHMVSVRFVVNAAHNPDNEEAVGKGIFDNWVFTQGGAFKVKAFLKALGIDPPRQISKRVLEEEFIPSVLGQSCTIDVDHRMWNGEARSNIRSYYPPGGPVEAQPEHAEEPRTQTRVKNGKAALPKQAARKNSQAQARR